MRTNKRRLHTLETVIKPPPISALSADERAVLMTLRFQRRKCQRWPVARNYRRIAAANHGQVRPPSMP
jgi:hypothetical protein